jgi:hypothetical protein
VQVLQGKADAKQLAQEKQRLGQMQQKLEVLEDEKTKTASRANSLLSFLGLGGSSKASPAEAPASGSSSSSSSSSGAAGKQGIISKSRGSLPQQQQQAGAQQQQQSGSKNVLLRSWEALGQQLLQLEGRLSEQESKTQKQRLSVQRLQEKVRGRHCAAAWGCAAAVLAACGIRGVEGVLWVCVELASTPLEKCVCSLTVVAWFR